MGKPPGGSGTFGRDQRLEGGADEPEGPTVCARCGRVMIPNPAGMCRTCRGVLRSRDEAQAAADEKAARAAATNTAEESSVLPEAALRRKMAKLGRPIVQEDTVKKDKLSPEKTKILVDNFNKHTGANLGPDGMPRILERLVGFSLRCNMYCIDHKPADMTASEKADLVQLYSGRDRAEWSDDECCAEGCGRTLGEVYNAAHGIGPDPS